MSIPAQEMRRLIEVMKPPVTLLTRLRKGLIFQAAILTLSLWERVGGGAGVLRGTASRLRNDVRLQADMRTASEGDRALTVHPRSIPEMPTEVCGRFALFAHSDPTALGRPSYR